MINTEDLLLVYRHAKALVKALEKVLLDQMVIRCTGCGLKHRANEPHGVVQHSPYAPGKPIILTKKMVTKDNNP